MRKFSLVRLVCGPPDDLMLQRKASMQISRMGGLNFIEVVRCGLNLST